jgi:glycerophosphoryl diester phosphodiesterase
MARRRRESTSAAELGLMPATQFPDQPLSASFPAHPLHPELRHRDLAQGVTMPAIIAHRGASAEAPENTIRAFERAIGIGVDRIELDLRRAGDGGIVVIHDAALDRLCDDPRQLSALATAEVQSLPVLAKEYGTAPNMRIPGLDEVLDRIAPRCALYLELKTDGDADPEGFTDTVLDLLPTDSRHRIASFDARVVEHALEHGHPAVLIANDRSALNRISAHLRPRLTALSLRHTAIDATILAAIKELGIELWTWTVDDPAQWESLERLQHIDAWCTNDPRALRCWLSERNG